MVFQPLTSDDNNNVEEIGEGSNTPKETLAMSEDVQTALNEITAKLVGRWDLDRSENFEDILQEMGKLARNVSLSLSGIRRI